MKDSLEKVRDFHTKYGFLVNGDLKSKLHSVVVSKTLRYIGEKILEEAKSLEKDAIYYRDNGDERLYRCHLMTEEFGELLISLADMDEEGLLDGIDDVIYTILGTAVAYDQPADEGFDEVHRSNMTKPLKTKTDPRMRDKVGYVPPNLKGILAAYKARKRSGKFHELRGDTGLIRYFCTNCGVSLSPMLIKDGRCSECIDQIHGAISAATEVIKPTENGSEITEMEVE
jgi:predicted HAD superfamily Cof-like phosphohydrolase